MFSRLTIRMFALAYQRYLPYVYPAHSFSVWLIYGFRAGTIKKGCSYTTNSLYKTTRTRLGCLLMANAMDYAAFTLFIQLFTRFSSTLSGKAPPPSTVS